MKTTLLNFLQIAAGGLFSLAIISCSQPEASGAITGVVLLPNEIELSTVAPEARIYIYLKDYTSKNGKEVLPWEAPTRKVVDAHIRSLTNRRVSFEFKELPKGIYGVSVLVDTGRPHVPEGSLNFTAFPGDYAGGTKENVNIEEGRTVEVSISSGLYVSIPDGYKAPLYSPD